MAELTLDISILLIDDSRFARTTLMSELKNIGFAKFFEAGDADDALEHLGRGGVDLVFCDQQMPGMTGTELLHKIRRDQAFNDAPFILITGHVDKDVIAECVDYGGDAVVVKPFSSAALEDKINQAFRERRQSQDDACEDVCTVQQIKVEKPGQDAVLTGVKIQSAVNSPKALLQVGLKLEAEGNAGAAAQKYMAALELEQGFMKAHEALARLYEKGGDKEKALEHQQRAVELSPGNFQRRFDLAEIYLGLDRKPEAIEVLQRMMAEGLKYPDLLRRVAGAFLQCGQAGEAETALLMALSFNPESPDIYKMLVKVYQQLGAQDKAMEAAENAVKAIPGKADLHWLLAGLLQVAGKSQRAKEQAGIALKLDPDNAEAEKLAGEAV